MVLQQQLRPAPGSQLHPGLQRAGQPLAQRPRISSLYGRAVPRALHVGGALLVAPQAGMRRCRPACFRESQPGGHPPGARTRPQRMPSSRRPGALACLRHLPTPSLPPPQRRAPRHSGRRGGGLGPGARGARHRGALGRQQRGGQQCSILEGSCAGAGVGGGRAGGAARGAPGCGLPAAGRGARAAGLLARPAPRAAPGAQVGGWRWLLLLLLASAGALLGRGPGRRCAPSARPTRLLPSCHCRPCAGAPHLPSLWPSGSGGKGGRPWGEPPWSACVCAAASHGPARTTAGRHGGQCASCQQWAPSF
jgi:hypothetical protein